MRALDRKVVRDLLQLRTQAAAVCLVIAAGVATLVFSLGAIDSLERARRDFYDRYRFADVFARLKRAPNALAARVAEIPGVRWAETRVVVDVSLDVPGMTEPAVGRLISLPPAKPGAGGGTLNRLHLRRGRHLAPGRRGEVVVSEPFANAHGLEPGHILTAVINQKREQLTVVGMALSPEYVMSVREGDLLPDDRRFGVMWTDYAELSAAFGLDGAFNDVAVALAPGASEADVVARLDRLTAAYGGTGAYGRRDQVSHARVSDELHQLRRSALISPLIFLSVAAFVLNMVIARLIGTQREQIATLRAFGYTGTEIGTHYLKLVLVICAAGFGLGLLAGAWLGREMMELYARFFRFPSVTFHLAPAVVAAATAASIGTGAAAALAAVRRAARLPPAQAVQPEAPAVCRRLLAERLGLQRLLSPAARMVLRDVERRPARSMLTVAGIALAAAILVVGGYITDTIDYVIDLDFRHTQRQDLTVTFVEPAGDRALRDLGHLPGVLACEPFRGVPVRLRSGHRERRLSILGLPSEPRLYRPIDARRRPLVIPAEGLLLSAPLATILDVRPGDLVTVEALEGERPVRQVPVSALVEDYLGLSAYMNIRALNRFMREGGSISGAFLTADASLRDALYRQLKQTPRVAVVSDKRAMLESFRGTIAENLLLMRTFQLTSATIIAFGVVYNAARISLSERARELATLRVLGFTRREVSAILLGELAVLMAAAIPLGLVLGRVFAAWVTRSLATESHRFPLFILPHTYAFAAAVTVLAAVASGLVVRRRIDRLDLVAVLKARE